MAQCRSALFLLLAGFLIAACGGDSSSQPSGGENTPQPPASGQPSPGPMVPIKGGERIAWDQAASSAQVARSYTYYLFIDGYRSVLANASCTDSRSGAGYECAAPLPSMAAGPHTLEVMAVSG